MNKAFHSLAPRPLPDLISQPWRNIGRRPGIIATSRTRNGGLVSPSFLARDIVLIPGLLPIFLHGCEIKSLNGLGTRLGISQAHLIPIRCQQQMSGWSSGMSTCSEQNGELKSCAIKFTTNSTNIAVFLLTKKRIPSSGFHLALAITLNEY